MLVPWYQPVEPAFIVKLIWVSIALIRQHAAFSFSRSLTFVALKFIKLQRWHEAVIIVYKVSYAGYDASPLAVDQKALCAGLVSYQKDPVSDAFAIVRATAISVLALYSWYWLSVFLEQLR